MSQRQTVSTSAPERRAILVGVDLRSGPSDSTQSDKSASDIWSVEDSLAELAQLARTAGVEVVGSVQQRLRSPHPATFIGKGKVEQLNELRIAERADLLIFDDELTPGQQKNLEEALGVPVIDRSLLILDVFAQRARTHEGRLQVELAQQEYLLPRFSGQWTHLSRQYGRSGVRGGPGETQLEVDRRHARKRIAELKSEIEKVRMHRQVSRERRTAGGLKVVALVGYTNAGKSTLMNALTHAGITAEDRPFDTLDPTTRRIGLPSGRVVLLTDTVGFVQKLPPTLVSAFRATLEELDSADILVHVLDVTHPRGFEQGQTVTSVLSDLGLSERPIITALNKVDQLAPDGVFDPSTEVGAQLQALSAHYPNPVVISAARRWGLPELLRGLDRLLEQSKQVFC